MYYNIYFFFNFTKKNILQTVKATVDPERGRYPTKLGTTALASLSESKVADLESVTLVKDSEGGSKEDELEYYT